MNVTKLWRDWLADKLRVANFRGGDPLSDWKKSILFRAFERSINQCYWRSVEDELNERLEIEYTQKIDDWRKKEKAEATKAKERGEDITSPVSTERLIIAEALRSLGRHTSNAGRRAREIPKSWTDLDMAPFFPLCVANDIDIRDFAPPHVDVIRETVLEVLSSVIESLNWPSDKRPNIQLPELSLASKILQSKGSGDLILAIVSEERREIRQAIAAILARPGVDLSEYSSTMLNVASCERIVVTWCVVVGLLQFSTPSAFEDLIHESE